MTQKLDLARDRTLLANERTFASWVRTGIACLALAIGIRAVFYAADPLWPVKALASLFILLALFIFVTAFNCATKNFFRLHQEMAPPRLPLRLMRGSAALLGAGALATGALLWAF